jgi:predicted dehydrogenase
MAKQIRKLNVAMIGYGFMGRAHSNAFLQVGHFFDLPCELKLKAMCGRNRATVEAMAAQWGWEEVQTDWHSVVKRKDIDVVDICAPNHLHAQIARDARHPQGSGSVLRFLCQALERTR